MKKQHGSAAFHILWEKGYGIAILYLDEKVIE
jgi:hypothetical protein